MIYFIKEKYRRKSGTSKKKENTERHKERNTKNRQRKKVDWEREIKKQRTGEETEKER